MVASIGTIRCNREWRRTCSPYTYKNSSVFRIKAAAIGGDSIRKKKTAGSRYDQAFYSGHFVWFNTYKWPFFNGSKSMIEFSKMKRAAIISSSFRKRWMQVMTVTSVICLIFLSSYNTSESSLVFSLGKRPQTLIKTKGTFYFSSLLKCSFNLLVCLL